MTNTDKIDNEFQVENYRTDRRAASNSTYQKAEFCVPKTVLWLIKH